MITLPGKWRFALQVLMLMAFIFGRRTGLADDSTSVSDADKDAEIRMLRAAVKKNADELQPLRDKLAAAVAQADKLKADLAKEKLDLANAIAKQKAASEDELTEARRHAQHAERELAAANELIEQLRAQLTPGMHLAEDDGVPVLTPQGIEVLERFSGCCSDRSSTRPPEWLL